MSGLRGAVALTVLGAVAVLLATGATWVAVEPGSGGADLGARPVTATGRQLYAGVPAMAWVALAGVLVVVATRGLVRRLVGLAVALAGVVALVECARALGHHLTPALHCGGPCFLTGLRLRFHDLPVVLALAGALALVAAGVLVAWRGGAWGGLGSTYQPPGGPAEEPVTDKGVWDALDRGDDPTA